MNFVFSCLIYRVNELVDFCVASIDRCHIPFLQPMVEGRVYFARNKKYSVTLQGVVDAREKFIYAKVREPGAMHDARVLRRSNLYHNIQRNTQRYLGDNYFIMGDSNSMVATFKVA